MQLFFVVEVEGEACDLEVAPLGDVRIGIGKRMRRGRGWWLDGGFDVIGRRFSDCFKFLANLPKESHIWCGYSDLMGPLLETFHYYFNDKSSDSPLKHIWKRISMELGQCMQCIFQHHQAQESYNLAYESDAVGPLLKVLRSLDEERVAEHIEKINARIKHGEYDADSYSVEVISIMFEVLTYPLLLEDQSLVNEFQIFLDIIDNYHDVTLAGSQQYMGVYALLFLKSGRARAIGFRLAESMGKLRLLIVNATFLCTVGNKMYIAFAIEALYLLDSFSFAFPVVLHAQLPYHALSPSSFLKHTFKEERSAADLDPLQPLLKKYIGLLGAEVLPSTMDDSRPRVQLERTTVWIGVKTLYVLCFGRMLGFLEAPAYEEGILERYPVFLNIVLNHVSGDTPDFSYAVACLRISFEILGSKLWLRTALSPNVMRNTLLGKPSLEAHQDGEHEKQRRNLLYFLLHQVNQSSNFSDLMRKNARKIALLIVHRGYKMVPPCPPFECAHMWSLIWWFSRGFAGWLPWLFLAGFPPCTLRGPTLVNSLKNLSLHSSLRQPAFDLITTIIISDASALISLKQKDSAMHKCKLSTQGYFIDEEDEPILSEDVEERDNSCWTEFNMLSKLASSECTCWACIPMLWTDCLVEVGPATLPITFSKAVFWALSRLSVLELNFSVDISLSVRDWLSIHASEISSSFGWQIPTGFDDGGEGKESRNSIKASYMGIPLLRTFKRLAAEFILQLEKLELQKQWTWEPKMAESLILSLVDPDDVVRKAGKIILEHLSSESLLTSGLQFLCSSASSLSAMLVGLRFMFKQVHGNPMIDSFHSLHHVFFVSRKLLKELMTCVRLLETLPAIYERLSLSISTLSGSVVHLVSSSSDFKWLSDLVDWGRSHLVVVIRHWKQCMQSLLNILKNSYSDSTASMISSIEKLISTDTIKVDNLQEEILMASCCLASFRDDRKIIKPKSLPVETRSWKNVSYSDVSSYFDSNSSSSAVEMNNKNIEKEVVVLSDDEPDKVASMEVVASCCTNSESHLLSGTSVPATCKGLLPAGETKSVFASSNYDMLEPFPSGIFVEDDPCSSQEEDNLVNNKTSNEESFASKIGGSHMQERGHGTKAFKNSSFVKSSSHRGRNVRPQNGQSLVEIPPTKITRTVAHPEQSVAMIEQLVQVDIDDPLELALGYTVCSKPVASKPTMFAPKRKVIQLQMPANQKSCLLNRMNVSSRRLKPPRLDVWYKSILEMDYFVIVGLYSTDENDKTTSNFNEVPLHFQSSDHYVKIFQPLVLEEFKAQLRHSFLESSVEDKHCGSLSIVSVERIDDFHIIRGRPDEKGSEIPLGCLENDLVLLTKEPLENSVQSTHVLGKVERREKSDKNSSVILVIRLYLPDTFSRLNKVKRLLIERSKWFLSRVMSITPQLREFQALSSLNAIPMLPVILNPADHSLRHTKPQKLDLSKLSQFMQDTLKSSFNVSQLQAISDAIRAHASRKFDLSLIQGPPGTGKTRTIVAIVGALLALQRVPKNYSSNVLTNTNREVRTFSNPRTHLTHSTAVARAWQDAAFAKQLFKDAEKESSMPIECASKGRVLICAQSNAAVDELVSRISEGLCGNDGKIYKPFIVRVGNAKTVHPNSLPFFIDTLVEVRLAEEITTVGTADGGNDSNVETSRSIRAKLEKLVERIQYYESKRVKSKDGDANVKDTSGGDISKEDSFKEMSDAEIGAKLNNLYREKKLIFQDLASAQAREKKNSEESRALKRKLRKSILREAEIVVTTLSGCGGDLYEVCYESSSSGNSGKFSDQCFFDVVVIDEAAQALEPATLIPLQLLKSNGANCIMVGDPKQLPATVLSSVASQFLYECSMFERLQRAGHPVILLTEQYRMHPEICSFPSLHFYDNKLLNGVGAASKSAQFHEHVYLGPYMFFDIPDGREHHGKSSGSLSLYNEAETEAAITIMRFLRKRYSSDFTSRKIGIITPYKSQLHLLRSRFSSVFGSSTVYDMEFNTVDGFQGREVDIVVLTTVRSSISSFRSVGTNSVGIGFVADIRRMNVALTRAKISLWIVGNARTLQTNLHWAALVQNAKERNLFISVVKPYDSFFERSVSLSGRNSSSSRVDVHQSHAKKNERAKSRREIEQDKNNERDAHRKKTKLAGSKPLMHSTRKSGLVSSKGNQRVANDKNNKFTVTDATTAQEDETIKLQKQDDGLASSGNTSQKNAKCSRGGSKVIPENVQLRADSLLKTVITDKVVNKFSGHAPPSKLRENTTNLLSSGKSLQQEGTKEKSKPSDVKTTAKDLLAARKRQRDDIEALLPSALISSKKIGRPSNAATVVKRINTPCPIFLNPLVSLDFWVFGQRAHALELMCKLGVENLVAIQMLEISNSKI
ncbi:hypothetical protein IEQ34_005501 [Dendrobium chrysotoxum]|uniref:Uncharacterized protein n=1 Tax=Dendrobium chrysotoxum TaxID=161865 RepID=A0AAV7HCU8_DENCH|nr:hypothetical protein IEQ34_005501 [Dendrobium chrysotoxum]